MLIPYKEKNLLMVPDTGLPVKLTINITFQQVEKSNLNNFHYFFL